MSSLSIIKPPSAQCLPSDLFDKWPLPSVHGTITVFTFCSVLLSYFSGTGNFEKKKKKVPQKYVAVIPDGQKCRQRKKKEAEHFIQHQAPLQSKSTPTSLKWQECRHTALTALAHKNHCAAWKKALTLVFIKTKHEMWACAPPPSHDWTINQCIHTSIFFMSCILLCLNACKACRQALQAVSTVS